MMDNYITSIDMNSERKILISGGGNGYIYL